MIHRSRKLLYELPTVSVAAAVFAIWSISNADHGVPRIEDQRTPYARPANSIGANGSMLAESLAAAGIVEPSSEIIRIGTEISGTVERVLVTPGDRVNRGDPLFVLDSRIVQAELLQRRSDLMAAEARLAQARARIPGLAAEVEVARRVVLAVQADNDEARDIVRIADRLQLGDTISERELTRRKNLLRGADARLGEAQARLAQAEANLALLNEAQGGASIAVELAAVSQAMAAVKSAETNLDVRTVRATIDGTVLQVNVRPGEFAQADWGSQALVTLGATNLLHIRVDIDEVDAPRWRQDAAATAVQRGAPLNAMRLTFVRREPLVVPKRALSGLSAERVDTRVMQVIYAIDTAGATILPGQQLDVLIEASKSDVQASIGQ